jgi:dienelactone hydrolase
VRRPAAILGSGVFLIVAPGIVAGPESVVVPSGKLALHALLYRPAGRGPFPAVLFTHGSARATWTEGGRLDAATSERQASVLGPFFARHGYVFLFLFRRGEGRSAGQGVSSGDLMEKELAAHGQDGRNRVQLRLLETDELDDALAGLAFLRAAPDVDARRLAVVGHSFGGSLALLAAERDRGAAAVVVFAGAANSWAGSPPLRDRLVAAVRGIAAPVFFVYAANDYSVEPAHVLGDERARLGFPGRVRIYPPVGSTAEEGHALVSTSVGVWEEDVFAFLDETLRR